MKGVILAGGTGTRLYPLTKVISKQLLPVCGKPMIYYPLSVLMEGGIRDILIISTPQDIPRFQALLGDGSDWGIHLQYTVQPSPDGIAQALLLAEDYLENDCVTLILGDNLFHGPNFSSELRLAISLAERNGVSTIFAKCVPDPARFGVVEFNDSGHVLSIEEKPLLPKSPYCITGLYVFDSKAVSYSHELTPSQRGELEITDVIRRYMLSNMLRVSPLSDNFIWMDAGTHDSYIDATNIIHASERELSCKIGCPEEIAFKNSWITLKNLAEIAALYGNNQYGKYLQTLTKAK